MALHVIEQLLEKMIHLQEQTLAAIVDIKLEARDDREEICIDSPNFDYTKDDIQGEIPQRATNALLKYKGVITFGELAKMTEEEVLAVPGIGPVALFKIVRALEWRGLSLAKPF